MQIEKHFRSRYDVTTRGGFCLAVKTATFAVSGLAYEASAETIEKRLCQLAGVAHAEVLLKDKTVRVSYDEDRLSPEAIIQAIEACGYEAWLPDYRSVSMPDASAGLPKKDRTFIVLILLCIAVVLCGLFIPIRFVDIILMTIGLAVGFIDEEDDNLRHKISDERILVSSAVLTAAVFAILQAVHNNLTWPFALSALVILLVHHIANRILQKANVRARQMFAPSPLPQYANLAGDHTESIIDTAELHKNDVIILRPGEVSPVDGIVIKGFAHMNEKALSGSSQPLEKSLGSSVYAGASVIDGNISIRIKEVGDTTAMMKFTSAARKNSDSHAKASPLSSTGHSLLIYLYIAAAASFIGWYFSTQSFYTAAMVSLSILACGALHAFSYISLSAVNRTSSTASKDHILYRSIEAMRDLADTDALYLEQDDIITSSAYAVDELTPLNSTSRARLGYMAYALLSHSARPAARAILAYLRQEKISSEDINSIRTWSRQGRTTFLKDENGFVGSPSQCDEEGIDLDLYADLIKETHEQGRRIFFFAENHTVIGYAIVHKPLQENIAATLQDLKNDGMELNLFVNGTDFEADHLKALLPLDHLYVHTEREEKKKLLSEGRENHVCSLYVSSEGANGFEGCADYCVLAHAGAALDRTDCDVLYASRDMKDLKTAVDLSARMRTVIEQKQALVIIYHIAMMLFCGLFFPLVFHTAVPAFISVCGALFCLYLAAKS